jgi:hypothetical protein
LVENGIDSSLGLWESTRKRFLQMEQLDIAVKKRRR